MRRIISLVLYKNADSVCVCVWEREYACVCEYVYVCVLCVCVLCVCVLCVCVLCVCVCVCVCANNTSEDAERVNMVGAPQPGCAIMRTRHKVVP
jgi:hypothetical protein